MTRKHISQNGYDEHRIQQAYFFLSNALQESGHNSKPVFVHSARVATVLAEHGFPQATVEGGVLHDVVEDTEVTVEMIRKKFGAEVARLVEVLTLTDDHGVEESFNDCLAIGPDALAIRAVDLMDNSFYYSRANPEMQKVLRRKFELFMSLCEGVLDDELFEEMRVTYERNVAVL